MEGIYNILRLALSIYQHNIICICRMLLIVGLIVCREILIKALADPQENMIT